MSYESRAAGAYPDVTYLPPNIVYAEGFRNDAIALARSSHANTVVTNLPVQEIPQALASLCGNIAEQVLLGYVIALGDSIEYAHLDYSVAKMQVLAREFADKFLRPLSEPDKSIVIPLSEMDSWFARHRLYGWGRCIKNPPGTEYA